MYGLEMPPMMMNRTQGGARRQSRRLTLGWHRWPFQGREAGSHSSLATALRGQEQACLHHLRLPPAPCRRGHNWRATGVPSTISRLPPAPCRRGHNWRATGVPSTISRLPPAPCRRGHNWRATGVPSTISRLPPAPCRRGHNWRATRTATPPGGNRDPECPLHRLEAAAASSRRSASHQRQ